MVTKGIHLLGEDPDYEAITKSACDGGGLWVKVNKGKSGRLTKVWTFYYPSLDLEDRYIRRDGSPGGTKIKEMGLGSIQKTSAEAARAEALRARNWLTELPEPKDPILQRRAEREKYAPIANATVSKCIDDYVKHILPSYDDHGQKEKIRQLTRLRDGVGNGHPNRGGVGKFHPKDVTGKMLRDLTGYGDLYLTNYPTSQKLFIVMAHVFARAKADSLCTSNPVDDLKVVRPRRAKKHKAKHKLGVHRDDMYEFLIALRGHRHKGMKKEYRPTSTYACEMLAITGVRVSEVIEATWGEIDRDYKKWTVPWQHLKIKDDEVDRPIPITSSMKEILLKMRERCGDEIGDDDPVFPSPIGKRSFYTHQAVGKVFEMIGWLEEDEKLHNHGFRTTLSGWGDKHSLRDHVEVQLHHKRRGTMGHYDAQRDDWEGRRAAMQKYDDDCNTPKQVVAEPLDDISS